ncbi:AraC family transcriptional regulator [Granulicella sp. dw_53]|uniref:AraC family transcriptional regulator n=1 Tax=Granulicella sp. dw_53 TaxID=2719792 RepID=UPI001BD4216F|nr:AraC family transcriptional regulator [Granulicella sp. dw_53]
MTPGECPEPLQPALNETEENPYILTPSVSVIHREFPPDVFVEQALETLPQHCHLMVQLLSPHATGEYDRGYGLKSYRKRRSDLCIIPSESNPRIRLLTPGAFFLVFIEKSFVQSLFEDDSEIFARADVRFAIGQRDEPATTLISLLHKEAKEGAPSGRLYSDSLLNALILRLAIINKFPLQTNSLRRENTLSVPLLRRVKDLIEAHLHENLSLDRIAQEVGCSTTHFHRVFRAATGQTPHQYVLESRLLKAQELLQRRTNSLVEVATQCGFASQSHMTDVFRVRLGVTPASFRKQTSNKDPKHETNKPL